MKSLSFVSSLKKKDKARKPQPDTHGAIRLSRDDLDVDLLDSEDFSKRQSKMDTSELDGSDDEKSLYKVKKPKSTSTGSTSGRK